MQMQDAALLLADRYELGPVLGEGGMAKVYRAVDRTLDRPVAVKVLAPPYDRDRGYVERFRREALAAARLNHPNIVTVFDSGEDADMQFIVMELVEGETLGARLRRTGAMAAEEVVDVGAAVASALAEAHARGVVHRDIKPGNVMLTAEDRVKVLDFGIARASGAEAVTRTGLVMGSASYLSPEQAQGSSADERSDVYALGCVLFQMATGRPPFVADDPIAALYQHVNEPVPRPSDLRPIAFGLEAVILRALEKDPDARFASAHDLEVALRAAPLGASPPTDVLPAVAAPTEPIARVTDGGLPPGHGVVAPSDSPTRPRWLLVAAVAAGLAILAGLLVWTDAFGDANPSREARREARAARTESSQEANDLAAVTGDADVDEPYAALVSVIAEAEDSGALASEAAEAFRARAADIVAAYGTGDAGAVDDAVRRFTRELAQRLEGSDVAPETALSLRGALDSLVVAMATGLPTETSRGATGADDAGASEDRDEGDGDEAEGDEADADERGGDDQGEDDGGDPPGHSNAGGNGKGNDGD